MANEKMMILKMLEEGKITSAEAARLLESTDGAGETGATGRYTAEMPPNMPPPVAPPPPRAPETRYENRSNDSGRTGGDTWRASSAGTSSASGPSGGRGFDELTGDLSRKFEAFAKDIEPKLQKFTETVAEKIVTGADRISRTFSSDGSAPHSTAGEPRRAPEPPRAAAARPAPAPAHGGFEKNIEIAVSAGYNELSLSGQNGDMRVKGYNGDKITARITYKPKRNNASIELMKLGGKYFLRYEEDDFERVSVDAFVPERMFNVINISGVNGNMDISSLAAREMQFSNANGQTMLAGLAAEHIKTDCSTGRLTLTNIAADSAIIENFNGNVDAAELDIAKLSVTNYNGALTLLMSVFNRYNEYLWSVETSNAKLLMNIPTLPTLGYHIKAHTTLGEIRLGLTGLQYIINDPALVEARSVSFDRAERKVKLAVETSNAPLTIN